MYFISRHYINSDIIYRYILIEICLGAKIKNCKLIQYLNIRSRDSEEIITLKLFLYA